jgi:hypothetical protein
MTRSGLLLLPLLVQPLLAQQLSLLLLLLFHSNNCNHNLPSPLLHHHQFQQ